MKSKIAVSIAALLSDKSTILSSHEKYEKFIIKSIWCITMKIFRDLSPLDIGDDL
jgi:hypothetical protein